MKRDVIKSSEWFDYWIDYEQQSIQKFLLAARPPIKNPSYQPQFLYGISNKYIALLMRRYSRGDKAGDLTRYFPLLLDVWGEAERAGEQVWTPEQQRMRHSWKDNLDFYITCFWLVGLALTLEVSDEIWVKLLSLAGNEGEDALLDRIIASRQSDRKIGKELCYPRPYGRLFDVVNSPPDAQPRLLLDFLNHWYVELGCPQGEGASEAPAVCTRPYWYNYHELEGGYFGYWCIEAVAAVKAFGVDDCLCLGHPNYPGDLLGDGRGPASVPSAVDVSRVEAEEKEGRSWLHSIFNKRSK